MRKSIIFSLLMLSSASALCVPAKPGLLHLNGNNGEVVEVYLHGDERMHYYETPAGNILLRLPGNEFHYAEISANGLIVPGERFVPAHERQATDKRMIMQAISKHCDKQEAWKVAPGTIAPQFPTTGEIRCLVILADYPDVKFTDAATKEYFEAKINGANYSDDRTCGSVHDYFTDQSSGQFNPVFDIVGPITMPHERSYYGLTEDIVNHVRDACLEVDQNWDVDFSRYDSNGDGYVDFVAVLFAGHGEAQGGDPECFWPAMMDLSNSVYDMFDGKYISRAFCSCELADGSGTKLDGIGTFVHEFSHVLGLPDIYDSSSFGGYGMGHYDIMCFGPYNNDGCCPAGYTALDRYTVGWLEPTVLEGQSNDVELEPLSSSNKAYFIVNPDNQNEYYTLENRQADKWDAGLPGHGLVISYVHYVPSMWKKNTVNALRSTSYEHVRIVAADGRWGEANEQGDVYPGESNNKSFTDTSMPAATWHSSNSPVGQPVTNIRQDETGNIRFDFGKSDSGSVEICPTSQTVYGGQGYIVAPEGSRVYNVYGTETGNHDLPSGIYIVKTSNLTMKVMVK